MRQQALALKYPLNGTKHLTLPGLNNSALNIQKSKKVSLAQDSRLAASKHDFEYRLFQPPNPSPESNFLAA
jgi:hypothetical protein